MFWIKGGPGFGKSAIAANIVHRQRGSVAANWFCDSKSSELKDPNKFLMTIAFQLSIKLKEYRVQLLQKLGLSGETLHESCEEIRREIIHVTPLAPGTKQKLLKYSTTHLFQLRLV